MGEIIKAEIVEGQTLAAGFTGAHSALIGRWFEHLAGAVARRELSERTIETYRRSMRPWLAFLEANSVDKPGPATVAAFVASFVNGRKSSSVAAVLNCLKACYRDFEAHGIYLNIARATRGPRVRRDEPLPALVHADVGKLVRSIRGDTLRDRRDRALVALLYGTGARCISIVRARIADVDFEAGTLRHQSKGHSERDSIAYLPATTLRYLSQYLAARGETDPTAPLFSSVGNRGRGNVLTSRSMRRSVLDRMEEAGHVRRDARGLVANRGHCGPHSLRRSALTTTADAQGIEAAQTLAGHSSIDTTRRFYARIQSGRILRNVAAVLDLEGETA